MHDTDTKLLIDHLKTLLRKRKVTYKQLAKQLELSEVSIKRVFANYDCTISRLAKICQCIDLTLFELLDLTNQQTKNQNYFLTPEQEKFFAKEPYFFHIFRELYRGHIPRTLMSVEKLTKLEFEKILLKLDKLGLIEFTSLEKIKFLIHGQLRPNLDGQFFEKVMKQQNSDFLDMVYENIPDQDCCFQSSEVQLSKGSYQQMVQDINALGKKYRELSFRESKSLRQEDLHDIRWLIAFLPYKTNWKRYKN